MQTREWLSREVAFPDVSHSDSFVVSYNIFKDPRSSEVERDGLTPGRQMAVVKVCPTFVPGVFWECG